MNALWAIAEVFLYILAAIGALAICGLIGYVVWYRHIGTEIEP